MNFDFICVRQWTLPFKNSNVYILYSITCLLHLYLYQNSDVFSLSHEDILVFNRSFTIKYY